MPTARGLAAVGVVDGKIYVVGGQDDESLGDNQVYDPAADDWDIVSPLAVNRGRRRREGARHPGDVRPVPRQLRGAGAHAHARWLAAAAAAQNVVCVMGGSSFSTDVPLAVNEYFDPGLGPGRPGTRPPARSRISCTRSRGSARARSRYA